MIIQRFNLNLIPNQSPVIVHVNQYDTGTGRLIATLYEGNEPYSPNGTAVIQGTKPDGHGFQYTATLDGNVVTADLTEQMAPVAGDVRAQIVVTESSGVTGTFAFIIRVQPSALPSDADMSESDYPLIEEAIREAQEAVQTAQEAITETQENAEDSEAWAQGTRGGIPVGPTDPTYEHNAEYWAQYAERYAQGGLHYKASIPFANIPTTGMREGDMYDITDDFTTDSRFEEGAGIEVKGGTNIAWNSDNKWDILALPYIPKTTFNGRSGSILPMAGDYDSEKILLSSILHIGGETQNDVQEALEALSNDGVKSFNGRSGSVLPMAGDYSAEQVNYDSNQTVKQKIDALVTKEASDIAGQQSLLKDTVGFTGKNLLKYPYYNKSNTNGGITFTVNNDGSVTVNGTATTGVGFNFTPIGNTGIKLNGDYIISGNPAFSASGMKFTVEAPAGRNNNVEGASDVKYTFNNTEVNNIRLWIYKGTTINNVTIYPMIRRADITDPTYEPYHESVEEEIEQIYADNGVLGAKNLLPKFSSGTAHGITYTVDGDGVVTGNGTASDNNSTIGVRVSLKAGSYILSGCPSGGSTNTYRINAYLSTSPYTNYGNDTGEGLALSFTTDTTIMVQIVVKNGASISNLVFKPMLRLASDPDDTYQPYAMTNRELTEKVDNLDMFKKDIRINQTTGETLSSMLDRMLAALISYIQSLNTNYYVFLESLSIPGYDTISPERLYIINPSSTWTASEIMFSRVRATASDIKINSVAMYASSSNYYRGILKYDGSAGSVNNIGSNTDVTNITLRMMVFKQYG